jgi:hypothetical protein
MVINLWKQVEYDTLNNDRPEETGALLDKNHNFQSPT